MSLDIAEKCLALSSLSPPIRYLYTLARSPWAFPRLNSPSSHSPSLHEGCCHFIITLLALRWTPAPVTAEEDVALNTSRARADLILMSSVFNAVWCLETSTKASTRCNREREFPSAVPSACRSRLVLFDHAQPPEPRGGICTGRIYHLHSHLRQLLEENGKRSPLSSCGDPLRQKLRASL